MTTPGPDTVAVVRRGTRRVCQLTGDSDADGRPVLNATTRFGVHGAQPAVAIEHADRLWLVFGKAGADQDGHALAHTTVPLLDEDGPALAFVTAPHGQFRPLSVRGLRPLTRADDVVGGTSALGRLWLFVRTGGEEPATYLASAADPADGFVLHYLVSTAAEARAGGARFLSATAVPSKGRRDLPAPDDMPGLFVWGQGADNGVRAGWLSLDPPPQLATGAPHPRPPMLYFAGHLGWSPREGDAATLVRLPGPTLLSVNWVAELERWVLLYAETGGDTLRISCRTGTTPFDWGEPMTLLDPTLGPYTSWLRAESEPEALLRRFPLPAALPAAPRTQQGPRGPSMLTRYTRWDARSATATIFYTLTAGDAPDVHLVASQLSAGPGWRGWRPAPREREVRAAPGTAPAAAITGDGSGPQRSDLVLLGEDGGVWSTWRMDGVDGSDWHAWLRLDDGRVFARRSVTTCVWGPAHFDVFALDHDGGVWRTGWRFDRWLAWTKIGPTRGGEPVLSTDVPVAATAGYEGRVDVFGLGTDARLWWTWTVADQPWAPWQPLADHADDPRDSRLARSAPPAAVSRPGRLDVFAIGSDDRLWWRGLRGPAWSHWAPAADLTFRPQTPPVALVRGDGGLEVLAVGRDERIWRNAHREQAGTEIWAGWTTLSPPADDKHAVALSTANAPAAAWHDTGEVEVFATGVDGRIWHARYLPAPRPVPLHGWQPLSDWPAAEQASKFGTRTGPVTASRTGRVEVYALDEGRRVWRNRWC